MKSKLRRHPGNSAKTPSVDGTGNKRPTLITHDVSIAESNKLTDNNTMPHEVIRGALERELDLIQGKFETLLGKQALKEIFARRASALSEGALDPGMAARELTTRKW